MSLWPSPEIGPLPIGTFSGPDDPTSSCTTMPLQSSLGEWRIPCNSHVLHHSLAHEHLAAYHKAVTASLSASAIQCKRNSEFFLMLPISVDKGTSPTPLCSQHTQGISSLSGQGRTMGVWLSPFPKIRSFYGFKWGHYSGWETRRASIWQWPAPHDTLG